MSDCKFIDSSQMIKVLLYTIIICSSAIPYSIKAQQEIRDNFLVDKISRFESPSNNGLAEFIYDDGNNLVKKVVTGKIIEQNQVRDYKYVTDFEYDNNRVSKIYYQDLTHFQFSHERHLFYSQQGDLIRKENWKNGSLLGHSNYHYENGKVVSLYTDDSAPFEWNTILYDDAGNVSKYITISPDFDDIGQPIPGEFVIDTSHFEFDGNPRPNFGLDYLFDFQLVPWLGSPFHNVIWLLSNNNVTKAPSQSHTYNYSYYRNGLPKTIHVIYDPIGASPGSLLTITYKCANTDLAINDIPILNGNYQAGAVISSSGHIPTGGNVKFKSGNCIVLDEGFNIENNSNFLAEIENCSL